MNEIEKMMQNANVKKLWNSTPYGGIEEYYPPFTAEKQLKILCFIVNNKHSVTFHDQIFSSDKLTLEKIQEDLAWAINRIWQDLTEEEKQQVKGILEAGNHERN